MQGLILSFDVIALTVCGMIDGFSVYHTTVLVKSFAHLNGNFFLASLEEIGKLWK